MGTLIDTNRTRYTWAKVSETQFEDVPYALAVPTTGVTDANYTDFYTVTVFVNGVEQAITSYTPSTNTIDFGATIPAEGALLTIQVVTDTAGRNVTYNTVGQLRGNSLNQDSEQNYTLALQALEAADRAMLLEPTSVTASEDVWDARERRITDVATPTADTDAATKGYVDTQDTATLGTANDYTLTMAGLLQSFARAEDAVILQTANDYTDTELASGLATKADLNGSTSQYFNVRSPLLSTHATPVSYVQSQDASVLAAAQSYADSLPNTVNEDAGQILIGKGEPGATSSSLLTFDSTLGSEILTADSDLNVTGTATLGELSIGTLASSADILYESSVVRVESGGTLIELQAATPTADSSVATKEYVDDGLDTKADLNGSTSQVFSVDTATLDAHAVNKGYADALVDGTTGKYAVFDDTGIADGRLNDDVDGGVTLEVDGVSRFCAYTSDGTSYAGFKAMSAEGIAGELNVYSSTSSATKYGDSVANDVSLQADFDLYLGSLAAGKIVVGVGASKIITAESSGVTLSVEGTADGHLVTKGYIDGGLDTKADIAGSSTQTFDVATPTADTHAATKLYVDSTVSTSPLVLTDDTFGVISDDTSVVSVGVLSGTESGISMKYIESTDDSYRTSAIYMTNGNGIVIDPIYEDGGISGTPHIRTPAGSRMYVSSAYDAGNDATMDIGLGIGATWHMRFMPASGTVRGLLGMESTTGSIVFASNAPASYLHIGNTAGYVTMLPSASGATISSFNASAVAQETTVATGLNVSGKATATKALIGKTGTPSKAMEIYHEGATYGLRLSTADVGALGYIDLGCNANGDLAVSKPIPVASGGTGLSTLTAGRIPYGAGTGDFGNSENFVYSSGKLGIGTTAPTKKLEVDDATGAQARLTHSSGNYTDFQTDGDGNLTITPSGLSSNIGGVRWLKTPSSVSASRATTYDLTITMPDAATQIAGEFFGFIRDSSNVTSIHALRFMFHISKLAGDNITLVLGAKETVDGTGVTIDTVTVHSVSATQAVIRVTMTGAATGTLKMYQGHLRLSELVNSVSSASWE